LDSSFTVALWPACHFPPAALPASDVVIAPGTVSAHVVINRLGKPLATVLASLLAANITIGGQVRFGWGRTGLLTTPPPPYNPPTVCSCCGWDDPWSAQNRRAQALLLTTFLSCTCGPKVRTWPYLTRLVSADVVCRIVLCSLACRRRTCLCLRVRRRPPSGRLAPGVAAGADHACALVLLGGNVLVFMSGSGSRSGSRSGSGSGSGSGNKGFVYMCS
jgi:hypothetical protein